MEGWARAVNTHGLLIPQEIANNLIAFSEDGKTITYLHQNKKRNYPNPEEQVQAEKSSYNS